MAADWIEITQALLASRFSENEWKAVSTSAKAISGSDVLTTTIRATVNMVRGKVMTNPANTLGAAGTVPPELEDATLILLRRAVAARLPQAGIVFDKLRDEELKDAKALLDAVAKPSGAYISPPTTPGTGAPEPDGGEYGGEDFIDFTSIR